MNQRVNPQTRKQKFSRGLFLIKGQAGQRGKQKTFLCKFIECRQSPGGGSNDVDSKWHDEHSVRLPATALTPHDADRLSSPD